MYIQIKVLHLQLLSPVSSSLTHFKMKRYMEHVAFLETLSHAVSSDAYINFKLM